MKFITNFSYALVVFLTILPFAPNFAQARNLAEKTTTEVKDSTLSQDFMTSVNYFLRGGLLQFQEKNNLYYAGAAAGSLWYSFEHDDRMIKNAMQKDLPTHIDLVGDIGIPLNFPFLSLGFYYYGKKTSDNHMVQFAMEYTAALYLTLMETGILSYIPVHERPNTRKLSFWEKAFRDDSSFPSGHIIPYSVLFFKTLQFYGPYYSTIPLLLTVWSSMQRVREGRHYVSDVVGGFFLSAFASEGVRAAGKYKKNHPFYKFIFERNAQLGVVRYKNAVGPRLSLEF